MPISSDNCGRFSPTWQLIISAKPPFPLRLQQFVFLLLSLFLCACAANKKLTIAAAASLVEDVARASAKQSDLNMIRSGMPAYLMLMDGMVEAWPDNERLLIAAAQGYDTYTSSFVEEQDRQSAADLYAHARGYALRALEGRGLRHAVQCPLEKFEQKLMRLDRKDVPYLFWAATAWGNWIRLNLRSMEALAELPRVELMMRRVLTLDETFHHGSPHLFMGIWYASRPKVAGGSLTLAQHHFAKALELGERKFLMAHVYYAEHYALRAFDKELYTSLLNEVLSQPADSVPHLTLLNTAARHKARQLLTGVDELFE